MIVRNDPSRHLTVAELGRLLRALARSRSGGAYLASVLMLNLGLRVGEALAIRVDDVSENARSIVAPTLKRKKPTTHRHQVPEPVAAVVRRHVRYAQSVSSPWLVFNRQNPSRPISPRSIQRTMARAAAAAGLADRGITPHTLRHCRAMLLWTASRDRAIVAHDLRHADPRSADAYVHADEGRYRDALLSVPTIT